MCASRMWDTLRVSRGRGVGGKGVVTQSPCISPSLPFFTRTTAMPLPLSLCGLRIPQGRSPCPLLMPLCSLAGFCLGLLRPGHAFSGGTAGGLELRGLPDLPLGFAVHLSVPSFLDRGQAAQCLSCGELGWSRLVWTELKA